MGLMRRNWIHWLTAVAVLMGSFAPLISQARSDLNPGSSFAMEVCTPSGATVEQLIDLELLAQHDATLECAYCLAQGIYAIAIMVDLRFAKPSSSTLYPSLFYQAPKPFFAWMQLPSRAPPLYS
ncbi:MAG: DUF2946 domain-containing protein [Polynucleobacter sp.]|nr:DUF2946 domain-containing protein [Polynucleobacter sp.]